MIVILHLDHLFPKERNKNFDSSILVLLVQLELIHFDNSIIIKKKR
jgi:hypothetical protein